VFEAPADRVLVGKGSFRGNRQQNEEGFPAFHTVYSNEELGI